MLHKVAADSYGQLFHLVTSPIAMIPADGSQFLKFIRNQLLAWNYLFLYLTSSWVFFWAQVFYNDGKLFVTFWNQIISEQPFIK